MNELKTILVPADFTQNTEVALQKAKAFAGNAAAIHLINVQSPVIYGSASLAYRYQIHPVAEQNAHGAKKKLLQWKYAIESSTANIRVYTHAVSHPSIQTAIAEKARDVCADLIVIAKTSQHAWFPFLNAVVPSQLALQTGILVLTVKPGSVQQKLQTIVVPVTTQAFLPKLEIIQSICRQRSIRVHLLTLMSDHHAPADFHAAIVQKAMQSLRSSGCIVHFHTVHGTNRAKAILAYAQTVNADMVLVNPVKETRLDAFRRNLSDVLAPSSKLQVWAVNG